MKCRHCNAELNHVFVDLINCPPSNSMLEAAQLNEPEVYYPLKIFVCHECFLVQIDEMKKVAEIFDSKYTYFSSYISTLLAQAKNYVDMMMQRFEFGAESQVIEIASNDGYLLQYFKELSVPVLGVDPAGNTAAAAKEKGIETIVDFFGSQFARDRLVGQGIRADLIIGNNVLAHVPDINDFVRGLKIPLKPDGLITIEFQHLYKLVKYCQFDNIYHEHFSYLSLSVVKRIFENQGLELFDVEEIPTHGGSLRIFAKHVENKSKKIEKSISAWLEKEESIGMLDLAYYLGLQERIDKIKYDVLTFLIKQKKGGKNVIGYGAAAKGNTLLNYCGVKGTDLISFVVDASPHKQNKFLPGSRIPVFGLDSIEREKPDFVIILPWNLNKEIREQLKFIYSWGGKFVTFIPEIKIF